MIILNRSNFLLLLNERDFTSRTVWLYYWSDERLFLRLSQSGNKISEDNLFLLFSINSSKFAK